MRVGSRQTGDAQRHGAQRDLKAQAAPHIHAERACCGGTYEKRVGTQVIQAVGGIRDQPRLHCGCTEYVDADNLERIAAIGELCIELDHRARRGHLAQPRKLWIDRFVEAASRTSHLEIRIARKKLHAERELVDRCAGDELHCVAERDAECDGEHRQYAARLVLRERTGEHDLQRVYLCFVHRESGYRAFLR